MSSHPHSSSTANLVGQHYRVGKKIGEGSFGVIFEGDSIVHSSYLSSLLMLSTGRNQSSQLTDCRHQICPYLFNHSPSGVSLIPFLGTQEG